MDVTFMARTQTNITDLLSELKLKYPEFVFKKGAKFSFRPPRTIMVGPLGEPGAELLLLHEIGHAICKHRNFTTDIQRLKMEREAWEKARELAIKYEVEFDDELAEEELDSYREWLDHKSRCPKCGLARYQARDGHYHCPRCENFA